MTSFAAPGLVYTAADTILITILLFVMATQTTRMRAKHGVKAPSVTGPLEFECANRAHMNTIEGAMMFVPNLWIAAIWFGGIAPAIAGLVWVVGRVVYMQGYMAAPEKRSTGFGIQMLALLAVVVMAIWGVVRVAMTF